MEYKQIKRVDNKYYLSGSSEEFNSFREAIKRAKALNRASKKESTNEHHKYWSHTLQESFRSNWEIELAEMLTELGITYEYEPKRLYFPEGESYLPDFWLPDFECWIEVKGWLDPLSQKRMSLYRRHYKEPLLMWMKEERELCKENPKMLLSLIIGAIEGG
ncbi:holliday junction resolvase [Bacillus phage Novomoskovsk]|uniref:Holliday junction resolvase n=1 Tax=Bacillus phage Novomoskovsk TaxID=2736258 RepID=A0A6M9Z912_9CAUD|nr:holliday junction resolvase [Bacillus phage Novomoskovsk]